MSKKRRLHSPEIKCRIALEAVKGLQPIHAIAAKHKVHPTQVGLWQKELLARLPEVFARKEPPSVAEAAEREARLYQKIGQLEVELDWLKKKSAELHA
jgi:transposase-like protein